MSGQTHLVNSGEVALLLRVGDGAGEVPPSLATATPPPLFPTLGVEPATTAVAAAAAASGPLPRTVFAHRSMSHADPCSPPSRSLASSPCPGGCFSSGDLDLGLDDIGLWLASANREDLFTGRVEDSERCPAWLLSAGVCSMVATRTPACKQAQTGSSGAVASDRYRLFCLCSTAEKNLEVGSDTTAR